MKLILYDYKIVAKKNLNIWKNPKNLKLLEIWKILKSKKIEKFWFFDKLVENRVSLVGAKPNRKLDFLSVNLLNSSKNQISLLDNKQINLGRLS